MKYTVIGKFVELSGGVLTLSKEQAADRAHALKATGKNLYEIKDRVVFKQGESFGFEGEMPKAFIGVQVLESGKAVKTGKAEKEKAEQESVHRAQIVTELTELKVDFDESASVEDLEKLLEVTKADGN